MAYCRRTPVCCQGDMKVRYWPMLDEIAVRPPVAVAVDLAILTVRGGQLQILMVERGKEPYLGQLALPGGFVEPDEGLREAAARELAEETGLDDRGLDLQQLHSYGEPNRDPRGRVISVCYLALMPDLPMAVAGGDARAARWVSVSEVLSRDVELAFDHRDLVEDALDCARSRLEYTTAAVAFCGNRFTMTELRRVYEIVWGKALDPRNFSRKILGIRDFLVPTGERTVRDGGRPAALYRHGTATTLHPAMLRPSR